MEKTAIAMFSSAFLAGLASFVTPCVLPLVPVYLSILSGASWSQLTAKEGGLSPAELSSIHRRVLINAVAFIVGFSIVFIVLGLFAGVIGALVQKWGNPLLRIIGVIIVVFGMNMSGFWKPRFLNAEAKIQVKRRNLGLLSSLLIGCAFAFGWTPCVGPFLGTILVMAAGTGEKLKATALLATYSLGLGVPFFLSALSINGFIAISNRMKRHFNTFEFVLGTLLIFIGIYLVIGGERGINVFRAM